ncbi:hypothetical protein [Streptosporangium sp. KLBMP 9127]|nr:hypothetical protein [Streptosporangium sp. KLBMP 9127]
MASEIAQSESLQESGSASEITKRRPGARPTRLLPGYETVLGEYAAALERAPLSAETRRTYRSRVRMFLSWLADHAATYTADPSPTRRRVIGLCATTGCGCCATARPGAAASTSTPS